MGIQFSTQSKRQTNTRDEDVNVELRIEFLPSGAKVESSGGFLG